MINREVTNIWPGIEPTHTETADCTTRCYLVRGSLTQKEPLKLEGQDLTSRARLMAERKQQVGLYGFRTM